MGRLRDRTPMLCLRPAHPRNGHRDRDRPRWSTPSSAASALLRYLAARTGDRANPSSAPPVVVIDERVTGRGPIALPETYGESLLCGDEVTGPDARNKTRWRASGLPLPTVVIEHLLHGFRILIA